MKILSTIIILFLWLVLISFSCFWNIRSITNNTEKVVIGQGQSFFKEIQTTRAWNAGHGGVYVAISEETQPNPYLDVPNREIYIDSLNIALTKVNPAFMTRQIAAVAKIRSDIQYHITSLKPIRPANEADSWEKNQLEKFETGTKESFEYFEKDSVYRYMAPLDVKDVCMKCHAKQGYQIGDIRGGISVTIPAMSYLEAAKSQQKNILFIHIIGFLIGAISIVLFQKYSKKQFQKIQKANNEINQKNAELEQQKEEIQTQANYLESANTELNQQKEEISTQAENLKDANNKLLELDQFKEGMTGMIVHDLKNPLNSIIGLSDIVINENSRQLINTSGKQMLNMVLNILDVQKFEDAAVKINPESNSILQISKSAISQVSILLKEKSLNLKTNINSEYFALIDIELIERVFINILTNAIKYTPQGGNITIKTDLNNKTNFYKISITDTGEGIPEDQIDKVFDKFGQVEAKKSGKVRSTGIGLTFCKMTIEAHKGEIGVASKQGEGTTFWFTLKKSEAIETKTTSQPLKKEVSETDDKIEFSKIEKEYVLQFVEQFKKYEVTDLTELEEILDKIEVSEKESIKKWKIQMENAIMSCNELQFKDLLSNI